MKKVDVLALDGKLLRTFLAVYETQSATKAAEILGVTQSSVSHSLERLRGCLNDPLFVKSGRGITATSMACKIAPKIGRILGDIEGLSQLNEYDPRTDKSTFTIATNVTEILPILIAIKHAIGTISQDIPLRFIDLGARSNALEFLSTGNADFAITTSIGRHPLELHVKSYYQDQIACFYDPSQRKAPLTPQEYSAARHATIDLGGTAKSFTDIAVENAGLSRNVFLSTSNSYALGRMAIGTDLIVTLPKRLKSTAFAGFSWSAPPFPMPPLSYDLVCHRRDQDSSRHIWFRALLTHILSDFLSAEV